MPEYVYVAWFRDTKFPPDDQDYEWVGCWRVRAPSKAQAKTEGDRFATQYAVELGEPFLWSQVDDLEDYEPDSHRYLTPLPRR